MNLIAGRRFRLSDSEKFLLLKSGRIEVYAITQRQDAFRQIFLTELRADEAAFPSFDEFENIDIQLCAVDDSELEELEFEAVDVEQFWVDQSVLAACEEHEELMSEFEDNESMFSMLLGMRFQAEDKKLEARSVVRERHQKFLLDEAIGNLLDEKPLYREAAASGDKLEETAFLIKNVAAALGMPANNLTIAPEVVKKLDQIGLIRRLIQKGNMQMRLITLVPEWYTKDSGVIIGCYGDKKEPAAFIPIKPGQYKLITAKNPDGEIIDEEVAAKIDESAFECYAGLPLRPLKFLDLMKFMLQRSWRTLPESAMRNSWRFNRRSPVSTLRSAP